MVTVDQEQDEARPSKRMRIEAPLDGSSSSTPRDVISAQLAPDVPSMTTPPQTGNMTEPHETGEIVTDPSANLTLSAATAAAERDNGGGVNVVNSKQEKVSAASSAGADMGDAEKSPPLRSKESKEDLGTLDKEEASEASIQRDVGDVKMETAAQPPSGNTEAEWEEDSSPYASSDDDDESKTASDADSDIVFMDTEALDKFLMDKDEEGGDDGDKAKKFGDGQPRTINEKKEQYPPRPVMNITPEMKITNLGHVESIVGNVVLVKGFRSDGTHFVVDQGSVLCHETREVIGVVSDLLGPTQEPIYLVGFANSKELEEARIQHGSKVYYVDEHSIKVFTAPLQAMKGTDASNIYDEEVGEDEQEFSDDEAEIISKRKKKELNLLKKAGKGQLSRPATRGGRGGKVGRPDGSGCGGNIDAPMSTGSYGPLDYDDEGPSQQPAQDSATVAHPGSSQDDLDDGGYNPLRRPDNLYGPPPPRPATRSFERGRGRGARGGRGGDRGRGGGNRGRGTGPYSGYGGGSRDNSGPGSGGFTQTGYSNPYQSGNSPWMQSQAQPPGYYPSNTGSYAPHAQQHYQAPTFNGHPLQAPTAPPPQQWPPYQNNYGAPQGWVPPPPAPPVPGSYHFPPQFPTMPQQQGQAYPPHGQQQAHPAGYAAYPYAPPQQQHATGYPPPAPSTPAQASSAPQGVDFGAILRNIEGQPKPQ